MPSENKTPLGLNLWRGADRPKRDDFNTDNEKIDIACRTILTRLSAHLEGEGHVIAAQRQTWDGAAGHMGEGIATQEGLHGLRYYDGTLEVNVGGVWQPCVTATEQMRYPVYGVCVDTANADPETALTYTDDAVGMTPGGSEWDATFMKEIRPCLLKNGAVSAYLDPGNYLLDEYGQEADILSGGAGDVMVEIPKLAYAIYTEGDLLYIKVTNHPNAAQLDSRFCYNAHTRAQEGDRQRLYVGAYLGYVSGGRLRSLSGKQISTGRTLAGFRQCAQDNGNGYDLISFYPYMLLQCLGLIRCKNRDSQTAMGWGNVMSKTALATGTTDLSGMFFGEGTGRLQMKGFGIEDLWGNLMSFLDGIRISDNGNYLVATGSCHIEEVWRDTGRNGQYPTGSTMQVHGDNTLGFLTREAGGTSTTGWCDYSGSNAGEISIIGGYHTSRQQGGLFYNTVTTTHDFATTGITGRLMYL